MPKSKSDKCTRTETGKQHEYLQDLHLDAPRTPLVVTLGPTSDLDWLRFSYLLRNKNLSFDDIAELVSRYVPDDGDLPENDVAQEEVTAVGESDARDKTWRISVRRSGVVEWDVSTLGKEGHASTTSGVGNDRVQSSEPSCGAEVLKTNGIDVCHHGPPQPPNPPETVRIDGTTEQALRQDDVEDLDQSDERRSSEDHEISRSCFSSDSSADSVDFSKAEIGMQVTRMRPTMLSWLRPKRKYDSLQENTRPNSPGTKESSVGLWKRISRTTSHSTMNTTLVGKFDQKLQAKLSNAKLRASGASQIPANECHPAFREQADTSNVQPDLSTSAHILNAMRTLNSHRASQSVPSDTKPQRGSHNSSFSRPRPCSTHSTNIMPYGFHRPYRPSPLKHVTRVTSLDVNKGLPPLPPEARRLAHQASHARLKDLQAVKKVDIRKAINDSILTMPQPGQSHEKDPRWTAVDTYSFGHLHPSTRTSPSPSALQHALDASQKAGLPDIAVSPSQGKYLQLTARLARSKIILEVGTLGGYSTIWLATASPNVSVTSVEVDSHHADVARSNIQTAGLEDKVDVILGPGMEVLPSLAQQVKDGKRPKFDFVFIDADKENNWNYVDIALGMCEAGACVIVDNVVRKGQLAEETDDPRIAGAKRVVENVGRDERLDGVVLQTVGEKSYDGFLLAVVK
ncbi:hypothetical protein J4E80_002862 [Alternaria sp. BMP 0032]|nr:hypothetical protein J4E80_002862 [Alternaria sp. BMP 0032]